MLYADMSRRRVDCTKPRRRTATLTLQLYYPIPAAQKGRSFRREVVFGHPARWQRSRALHILVRNAGTTVATDASSPPLATSCDISENGPVLRPNHIAPAAVQNSQGQRRVMGMLRTSSVSHGATQICDILSVWHGWGKIMTVIRAVNTLGCAEGFDT